MSLLCMWFNGSTAILCLWHRSPYNKSTTCYSCKEHRVIFYCLLQSNSIIPLKENTSSALPTDLTIPVSIPWHTVLNAIFLIIPKTPSSFHLRVLPHYPYSITQITLPPHRSKLLFFVKHFSLKKASKFPVSSKGFSRLLAGDFYASRRMRACSIR